MKIPDNYSTERITFPLHADNIDDFSEWINSRMETFDVERENRIRIRLSMEEALLRVRDHFGEEQTVIAVIGRRFGRITIQVEMEGDAYNLLSQEQDELGDLCASLLTAVKLIPQYNFNGRKNILKVTLPIAGWNPAAKILVALIASFIVGICGRVFFPDFSQSLSSAALDPLFQAWWHILNAVSGPVMFFMAVNSILDYGKFVEWGGTGSQVVSRYCIKDFLVAIPAVVISAGIYQPLFTNTPFFSTLLEKLPQLFPMDILTPLIEFNAPQLLIIAFALGSALNILGSDAKALTNLLRQINMMGLQVASWVSLLVPSVVFVLVTLKFWEGSTDVIMGLWHCLLLSCLISVVLILAAVLSACRHMKVSFQHMREKIWTPFWTALRTGSLEEAYGETLHSCTRSLGIERRLAELGLPNGMVFYVPLCVVGTLVCINYLAEAYQVAVTPAWYIGAAVLTVLLSVAAPPVPGAGIITYSVLFGELGIPGHAMLEAMVFELIFNILASAGDLTMLQMELMLNAERFGLLNRKVLQRPGKN